MLNGEQKKINKRKNNNYVCLPQPWQDGRCMQLCVELCSHLGRRNESFLCLSPRFLSRHRGYCSQPPTESSWRDRLKIYSVQLKTFIIFTLSSDKHLINLNQYFCWDTKKMVSLSNEIDLIIHKDMRIHWKLPYPQRFCCEFFCRWHFDCYCSFSHTMGD